MNIKSALNKIFKNYLVAGTLVLVPLIGTFLILRFIIVWADDLAISLVPSGFKPDDIFGMHIPGLGLIATLIIVLLIGLLTHLYIGRKLVQLGDKIISKIPLWRSIYSGIKQFVSAVLTRNENKFQSVVMVEFPRNNSWTLGFVTGNPLSEITACAGKELVNVFVPTTPNPTSGYLIMVPKEDVRSVPISVDEAFKFIISVGILQH